MWDKPWKEDGETQGIGLWSEAEGGGRNNLHIVQYGSEEARAAAIHGGLSYMGCSSHTDAAKLKIYSPI